MMIKNHLKYIIIFFGIILAILFLPKISLAANWYVDNAATGSNNGTSWTNAWQSFAAIGWGSIQPGDKVYISGGSTSKSYNEQLIIADSGISGNPITIQTGQDSGHNGIVDINGGDTRTNCITISGRSYITVTGEVNGQIKMACHDAAQHGISASTPVGIKIRYIESYDNGSAGGNYHGITFSSNSSSGTGNEIGYSSVHDNYQDQIQAGTGAVTAFDYLDIHHNTLYNLSDDGIQSGGGLNIYNNSISGARIPPLGAGHPDGIQTMGGHMRVYNNYFGDMPSGANSHAFIDPINYAGQIVDEIWVYNNVFDGFNKNNNCLVIGPDTPNAPNGMDSVYVFNNTFVDCGARPISIGVEKSPLGSNAPMTDIHVKNNLIYNAASTPNQAIWLSAGNYTTSDVQVDYNAVHEGVDGSSRLAWDSITYTYDNFVSGGYGMINGRHIIPSFITYSAHTGNNDLHLQSTDTSAKDYGISLSSYFTTDKDSIPRPQGFAWDIGAYEYIASGSPSDTTPPSSPTGLVVN